MAHGASSNMLSGGGGGAIAPAAQQIASPVAGICHAVET